MNEEITYLLYEIERDGTKEVRLSREDGRLDSLVGGVMDCLRSAEKILRDEYPAIMLEVYPLSPSFFSRVPYQFVGRLYFL